MMGDTEILPTGAGFLPGTVGSWSIVGIEGLIQNKKCLQTFAQYFSI